MLDFLTNAKRDEQRITFPRECLQQIHTTDIFDARCNLPAIINWLVQNNYVDIQKNLLIKVYYI